VEQKASNPMRVFLSYGHDDNKELVLMIKTDLEMRGHSAWFDQDKIRSGHDWRRAITDGVQSSQKVLSFLSRHSTRDPGVCLDEIAIAVSTKGGNILTVLVESEEEVKPPPTISHIQWLDMREWRTKFAAGSAVWEEWYGKKIAEIIEALESKESQRFAGEIETLSKYLKPISSDSRVCALLAKKYIGREWLFAAAEDWRINSRSRLFWISGDPGVGKSAFAAQLAHANKHNVIATQFCQYDKADHRDAHRIVRNLAFQIAARLPDYRKLLLETLPEINELDKKDPSDLFDYLLMNPLKQCIDGGRQRYLILLDAVDESCEEAGKSVLVDMLVKNADKFPEWIGFIVTSRIEDSVTVPLRDHLGTRGGMQEYILINTTDENKEDIRQYLSSQLAHLLNERTDGAMIIERIVTQSDGVFLYAVQVCDAVLNNSLLLDNLDQFPNGLSELYTYFFERQFLDLKNYETEIEPVIGCIIAAREPLPVKLLQDLFDWEEIDLNRKLVKFGSLFPVTTENSLAVIKPYHKSLMDWLSDRKKSNRFFSDKARGHKRLVSIGWKKYIEKPGSLDRYYLRHLLVHLASCTRWQDALQLLHNRDFMELKSLVCSDHELLDEFTQLGRLTLRLIAEEGIEGNEALFAFLQSLLCFSFEHLENQELIQEAWFDKSSEILADVYAMDGMDGINRMNLEKCYFQLFVQRDETLLQVRLALRAAELNSEYAFLIKALEYESRQQKENKQNAEYETELEAVDEETDRVDRWVGNALFLVAQKNIQEAKWANFDRILASMIKSVRGIVFSTGNTGFFSRISSIVMIPFQKKVIVTHVKSILEVFYEILINYPRNQEVLKRLGREAGNMASELPVELMLKVPGLLPLTYSIVQNKWRKVSENAWHKANQEGDFQKEFADLFAIRSARQDAIIQDYADLILVQDYESRDSAKTFPALLDLAFRTGLVCSTDEMFPINRAIHGHLLYHMRKFYPDEFVNQYVRAFFLQQDVADLQSGFRLQIHKFVGPETPEATHRERVGGLYEMLMRFWAYEAMETGNPESILALNIELVRFIAEKDLALFCQEYNIVGRPIHVLSAVAIAEARMRPDEELLPETIRIIRDLMEGRLAQQASEAERWEAVSKCFFDLLYAGVFCTKQVVFSLGAVADIKLATQGKAFTKDQLIEPTESEVNALFHFAEGALDYEQGEACKKAVGRLALVLIALKMSNRPCVEAFFSRSDIPEASWQHIRRWALYIEKNFPSPRGKTLSPEKVVEKYYEQMAIGLFTNIAVVNNKEMRALFSDIIRHWLDENRLVNKSQSSLSKEKLLELLKEILVRLLELLKKYKTRK
jgi:hypothetical protein